MGGKPHEHMTQEIGPTQLFQLGKRQTDAVLNLHPAAPLPDGVDRDNLELLFRLNEVRRRLYPQETELDARIRNYELAARMQQSALDVLEITSETPATRRLYGLDDPVTENFGTRCLMARRLVESGVRFVQVTVPVKSGTNTWDHHEKIKSGLEELCPQVDRPTAALIQDLKARGLLDQTIVLWTGEFGRLPISQGTDGRDHNRHGFSMWIAGGGFRGGYTHGATDDFGYKSVQDVVTVHDLHATLLHALGLDHRKLTYPHEGRLDSLTDAEVTKAKIVPQLLV